MPTCPVCHYETLETAIEEDSASSDREVRDECTNCGYFVRYNPDTLEKIYEYNPDRHIPDDNE